MSKELDRFVEIYAKFKTGIDDLYTSLEAAGYELPEDRSFANLKAPVKEIIEGGGGGGITEISTPEEMEAFKTEANIGKCVNYTGETSDNYRSGRIYILLQEGGNIAFLDKSKFNVNIGGYPCQIYNYPLSHNFANGDIININFRLDGGEIQTVSAPYTEMPITETMNVQLLGDPEMEGMTMLVQNEKIMIYMMCYLNINPFIETEDGNMGPGQVYAVMWEPLSEDEYWQNYTPEIEIVSFEKYAPNILPNARYNNILTEPIEVASAVECHWTTIQPLSLILGRTYEVEFSYYAKYLEQSFTQTATIQAVDSTSILGVSGGICLQSEEYPLGTPSMSENYFNFFIADNVIVDASGQTPSFSIAKDNAFISFSYKVDGTNDATNFTITSIKEIDSTLILNDYTLDKTMPTLGLVAGKTYKLCGSYSYRTSTGSSGSDYYFDITAKAIDAYEAVLADGYDFQHLKGVVVLGKDSRVRLDIEHSGETGYYDIAIWDKAIATEGYDTPVYNPDNCYVCLSRNSGGGTGIADVPFVINSLYELQEVTNTGEVYASFDNTTERIADGGKVELYNTYIDNFRLDNIVKSSKAILYYTVDGVEKSLACYAHYREDLENGVPAYAFSQFESPGAELTVKLIDDEDNSVWFACFMGINYSIDVENQQILTEVAEGATFQFLIWNTRTVDIPSIEILGATVLLDSPVPIIEEERKQVINPLAATYSKPYLTIDPITSYPYLATSKDIRDGYAAYNDNGELIEGVMRNPETLETQEEIDVVVSNGGSYGKVYYLNGNIEGYPYGLYKVDIRWITDESGSQYHQYYLQRLLELDDLGDRQATSEDIWYQKQVYDADGNIITGTLSGCKTLTSLEEIEEIKSSIGTNGVFRLSGVEGYVDGIYRTIYGNNGYELERLYGPLNTLEHPATAADIRSGKMAYTSNRETIYGTMRNPETIWTEEQLNDVLAQQISDQVYELYNDLASYSRGLYKTTYKYVTTDAETTREYYLEPLYALEVFSEEEEADPTSVLQGKKCYNSKGEIIYGRLGDRTTVTQIYGEDALKTFLSDLSEGASGYVDYTFYGDLTEYRSDLYESGFYEVIAATDYKGNAVNYLEHLIGPRALATQYSGPQIVRTRIYQKIGQYAFSHWSDLRFFEIMPSGTPMSYLWIEWDAFNSCTSLEKFIIREESSVINIYNDAFKSTPIDTSETTGFIYVPDALLEEYKSNAYYGHKMLPLSALEATEE